MASNERTILRIRCSRELFRRFKKVAADYKDYEEALNTLVSFYEKHELSLDLIPKRARYVVR